jgi:hypothetical protein
MLAANKVGHGKPFLHFLPMNFCCSEKKNIVIASLQQLIFTCKVHFLSQIKSSDLVTSKIFEFLL